MRKERKKKEKGAKKKERKKEKFASKKKKESKHNTINKYLVSGTWYILPGTSYTAYEVYVVTANKRHRCI